jgi:uncharacterized membrane protein
MESKVKILGHPLHPLLVHLPVGLWVTSLIFDILALATGMPVWAGASFWMMVFGSGFALFAAIPGFLDYLFLDMTREAHRIATYHMLLNLTIVAIFIADILWRLSLFVRVPSILYFVPVGPFILSIIAVLLLAVSGWLGGQLVFHHHLGVTMEHPKASPMGALNKQNAYRPMEQQPPQA